MIHVFGGSYLTTHEVYNPTTNTWTTRAPLPVGLMHPAAALTFDGRVLCIGGATTGRVATANVYAYSASTDRWTPLAPLPTANFLQTAVSMDDGRIFVFGGDNSAGVALRYDSSSNVWVTLPRPIPTPRYEMSSAVGDGRILVMGGYITAPNATTTVEILDPFSYTWTTGASLPEARMRAAGSRASDARVYIVGGAPAASGAASSTPYSTNDGNTFTTVPALPTPRLWPGVVAANDRRLYVIGGTTSSGVTNVVEAYSPVSGTWR